MIIILLFMYKWQYIYFIYFIIFIILLLLVRPTTLMDWQSAMPVRELHEERPGCNPRRPRHMWALVLRRSAQWLRRFWALPRLINTYENPKRRDRGSRRNYYKRHTMGYKGASINGPKRLKRKKRWKKRDCFILQVCGNPARRPGRRRGEEDASLCDEFDRVSPP